MNEEIEKLKKYRQELLDKKKERLEKKQLKKEIRELENENKLIHKTIKFGKTLTKEIKKKI